MHTFARIGYWRSFLESFRSVWDHASKPCKVLCDVLIMLLLRINLIQLVRWPSQTIPLTTFPKLCSIICLDRFRMFFLKISVTSVLVSKLIKFFPEYIYNIFLCSLIFSEVKNFLVSSVLLCNSNLHVPHFKTSYHSITRKQSNLSPSHFFWMDAYFLDPTGSYFLQKYKLLISGGKNIPRKRLVPLVCCLFIILHYL